MADNEWTQERLTELRRLAVEELEARLALNKAPDDYNRALAGAAWRGANASLYLALDSGEAVLSLLDALERVTRERDLILRDAGFLLEVADFAKSEPGIVGTDTWIGASDGVRNRIGHAREVPQ